MIFLVHTYVWSWTTYIYGHGTEFPGVPKNGYVSVSHSHTQFNIDSILELQEYNAYDESVVKIGPFLGIWGTI